MDERTTQTPEEQRPTAAPAEPGMKEKTKQRADDLSAKAGELADRGKEQARRYGDLARSRAMKQADSRKAYLASELENFAGTLDEVSGSLGRRGRRSQEKLANSGASMLRKASGQLRERSSEELLARAEDELKARPGVVMAGLFALGFLGARLLRS